MSKPDKPPYPLPEEQRRLFNAYFNMVAAGFALQAPILEAFGAFSGMIQESYQELARAFVAMSELTKRIGKHYTRPEFGLPETVVDGKTVAVMEEVINKKAFGSLLHFKRDVTRNDPKVLIVSPMSGHYATQLRDAVAALLPHHDVYVTDWENARDVPLSEGDFGFDDYIAYLQEFIGNIGENTHVIGISQSTVPVLAAVALMSEDKSPATPISMTLMGGPIDPRAAETVVTRYASERPLLWFEKALISEVPKDYAGHGREVYPGLTQLMNLLSVNPAAHFKAHDELFRAICRDDKKRAAEIEKFYDEYLAVCDISKTAYLDMIQKVFKNFDLPNGTLTVGGHKVDPSKIIGTSLLTVEGGQDGITAPGQTVAAHDICTGLPESMHHHYVHKEANHYGLFIGKYWRADILPRIEGMIRDAAERKGITYDAISETEMTEPEIWVPRAPKKNLPPPKN